MINKVKEMIENGHSIKRISLQLNCSEAEIKKIVVDNGFSLLKEKFSEDKIHIIIKLYSDGISAKQLGIKYSIDKRRVQRWAENNDILRSKSEAHRFTSFDENKFDIIDDPTKAYWLGFFYADAYNCNKTNTFSLTLKKGDINHLEKLCTFINLQKDKIVYDKNELHPACTVRMYSKHLCEKMTELGCMQAKSFKIEFPKWLDKSLYSHFIRGIFDGDGSLTFGTRSGDWKFSIVSTKECARSISDIFENQIGDPIQFHCISKTNNNTYELEAKGNVKLAKILNYIYNGSIELNRLNRKYEKYEQFNNFLAEFKQKSNSNYSPITKQIKIEILDSLDSGVSPVELSKKYGLHTRTVRGIKYTRCQDNQESLFTKVVEVNGHPITAAYVKTLSKADREQFVRPIFDIFRAQGWIYPDYSESKLKKDFGALKDYYFKDDKLNNNGSLATSICKYFCKSFYNTASNNRLSPFEIWNDDDALIKLIKNRLVINWNSDVNETFTINMRMMIQGMRSMGIVPSTSIFKPAIAKYICEKYSEPGDTVGDYSCGFGSRLLGAMSCGRKYIGTDPLTVLELEEMKKFYRFNDCILINSGSEEYRGDENSVDLYWSSPPYFDQEVYSNDISQAYNRGEDYFYNIYWKKTLENIKYMLKPGKWFGLNIKNYPIMLDIAKEIFGEIKQVEDMRTTRSHLSRDAGLFKYEGIFMFRNDK